MRLLRSRSGSPGAATADGSPAASSPAAQTPGKGRRTPTRREAEGGRRGPAPPPPRNQGEALRRVRRTRKERRGSKAERRQGQTSRRERMMAGDERYLPNRDRGPDRAYVRDIVDARRSVMTLFMPLALVLLVSVVIPSPEVKYVASLITYAILMVMIVEGLLLGRAVNQRVRARFPETTASRLGLGYYAFTRAMLPRRLRVPKPRIAVGTPV